MTTTRRFAVLATLSLTCFATVAVVARQSPQPSAQPTFRAGVDVVQLDISVLDKDRKPVRGLTQDDFTILEDGKPQRVVAFTPVEVPDVVPPSTPWLRDVAPDVQRNDEVQNPRLFIIVMDDAMVAPDPAILKSTRDIAHGVVDRMGPTDLAAVVFTWTSGNTQDFTGDRTRLSAAIDKFSIGPHNFAPDKLLAVAEEPHFLASIDTLMFAASSLIDLPQARKTLVYVSSGVPIDISQTSPVLATVYGASGTGGPIQIREMHTRLIEQMKQIFEKARLANVNVYCFDPGGLDGLDGYISGVKAQHGYQVPTYERGPNYRDFTQTVASNTGGRAIIETNDFEPGLNEMFQENGSYYVIGYQPANTKPDGGYRRVDVKVDRKNVTVRTKNGYYAPDSKKAAKATNAENTSAPGTVALAGVLPKRDLAMQVVLAPFASLDAPTGTVAIVLGLKPPETTPARSVANIDVLVDIFTQDGVAQGSQRLKTQLGTTQGAVASDVLSSLDLKPGRYELRIATRDAAADKSGSVYAYVDVPNFAKAPVSLSGGALSVTPGPVASPRDRFRALMPIVPSSQREFDATDHVTAFLRVYQGTGSATVPVTLQMQIIDANGNVKIDRPATLSADRFTSSHSVDDLVGVPIGSLTPGEYLLTFDAAAGKSTSRRDVRFTIK